MAAPPSGYTLKDYIDRIRYELKDSKLPWEFLRQTINVGRRKIARKTRCLKCKSQCESTKDEGEYRIPRSGSDNTFVDCVEILDVYYDGELLDWIDPWEMRFKLQTSSSGVPTHYTYFGGHSQLTGYIQLYPFPSESLKIILIHAIQFPQPLINKNSVCELNDIIHDIVIDYVEAKILVKKWHPQAHTLLKEVKEDIKDNLKLKSY
ncbi:hypothetical protein KAU34_00730 [candidate division WOR-3 bacterium]|nr:hypothetical protein [candidate division WOR-3 bacterium]